MRWVLYQHRGNEYGVFTEVTWPHLSLGFSVHLGRFGHLTLHLPVGLVIVGCVGAALTITTEDNDGD